MPSDIYHKLLRAIKKKTEDLTAILDELTSEQIQNFIYQDGNKLVLKTVSDGNFEMVLVLLNKGFRSNGLGKKKYSPLQVAICKKDIAIVTVLLEYGAKPEMRLQKDIMYCEYCNGKHTATDTAMSILIGCHFDVLLLKMYIPMLAKCVNKTKYDSLADGTPVIYHVIGSSSCTINEVRAIHKAGGDVLRPDQWGTSPIIRAEQRKRFTIASYLKSLKSPMKLSNQTCDDQIAQIQQAVVNCFHDVLLQLCEKGTPLNTPSKGETPLYMAIKYKMCQTCVRILIENGANTNLIYKQMTPIHVCIKQKCNPEILEYLLECPQTNIAILDADGYTYMDRVLREIFDIYTGINYNMNNMYSDELKAYMRNFENLLKMASILFSYIAPITIPGRHFTTAILRACSRTICTAPDAIMSLQERTLWSISLMVRAYLSNETTTLVQETINKISKDSEEIEDSTRCERIKMIESLLHKMLGVKRLDFICKISIRKNYYISELLCLPKDVLNLPRSIACYILDESYSSMELQEMSWSVRQQ